MINSNAICCVESSTYYLLLQIDKKGSKIGKQGDVKRGGVIFKIGYFSDDVRGES